ncbi:hypothetical protein D9619_011684 [Psilocybe cf. subviscida]|uniref:Spindle pole body component n=1 Tax=Psilocybe cf. subviscida TaxID=2480587 RepID=A0A8H5BSN6_9AGAR|nr:hypothetical protein D9619_011684 [Psilocybe cf. subviscida]
MWSDTWDISEDLGIRFHDPLNELPRIAPSFFVPELENKPQNPIMDSLKLENLNTNLPLRALRVEKLPDELAILTLPEDLEDSRSPTAVEQLWVNALQRRKGAKNGILSWDRLRPSHSQQASPTPYLSEQQASTYASVRQHVQPNMTEPIRTPLKLTEADLLESLKMVVLGFSSRYHMWDPDEERFKQTGDNDGFHIDGKDDTVSSSWIARFLKIGTIIRRLESLLLDLRARSAKEGPTIHALAHSLSTSLDYLRELIARCPPSRSQLSTQQNNLPLLEIWNEYVIYEQILDALASLFGRSNDLSPSSYEHLDSSPTLLLSRVYKHLVHHFEHQSPKIIRAMMASILTSTSQDYIQDVGYSIGLGGSGSPKAQKLSKRQNEEQELNIYDEEEDEEDIFDVLSKIETAFPIFFPPNVVKALPAAQKSLILFRTAQPDNPLLISPVQDPSIRWLWAGKDIDAAWNCRPISRNSDTSDIKTAKETGPASAPADPDLAAFYAFDLEPGTLLPHPEGQTEDNSHTSLQKFIDDFPETLPPITPTLSELSALTFKNLLSHASTLSESLLSLFLKSPGNLNFQSHLVLLRSYLLVAAPSFKMRLIDVLFSDAGEYETDKTAHGISIRSLRKRVPSGKKAAAASKSQPWAVGLSPNLLEREMWPPVGADLSFFLRTVIVDSLETGRDREVELDEGMAKRSQVVEEAEWRLGFAIRDLPTDTGRERWLDPLCIEALDFLYMDYKPPHPLEILISPDVLSKYQRMFTFILRIFRVECALKSLFRMSSHRAIATYLFPTLTQSRKLLLHFRFLAQSFVASLSGYIFDTAIGGNFDPFLTRLSADNEKGHGFSDVFEVAERHSALLDDILSACLLRSGQRGIGDVLRHCLELVLEFIIVVGELHRGRVQEYQAALMIEDIFRRFCKKMTTLTQVLKGLVDRSSSSKLTLENFSGGGRQPPGGLSALYHLLLRLDLNDWWSKSSSKA